MRRETHRLRAFAPRVKQTVALLLLLASLACASVASAQSAAAAQEDQFRVDYTVAVADVSAHLFHVTTDVRGVRDAQIDLALPTWTPGWYTVENYAKNILRMSFTDGEGHPLAHRMTRKQTWRVETGGAREVKIEFDYLANVLALNQAKITGDFAFFTGTQLFLEPVGRRDAPSSVRLRVPEGWQIVSALKETSDPNVFTAPDYDTLVDSPTEMGRFDVTRFEVEGKPHYFVSTPAGAFSKEKRDRLAPLLAKIVEAERAVFDDLPYDKYVYFYFFAEAESNAAGGLEHNNSHVVVGVRSRDPEPEALTGIAAHEFFHLWNVKRLRPAAMWPYDYARDQETPSLWVSEGFTNYYGSLARYRAGLSKREDFLESVARAAQGVEQNPARAFISPSDASVSTWLCYDTPCAFAISYYTQGQNLGALLDLSIIHDTAGQAGLDEVMRTLYNEHYKRNRGFTSEDMIAAINRLTKRDYHDFYRRYVWGVEVPPYDEIFGHAGYKTERRSQRTPRLDFEATANADGDIQLTRVRPDTAAAAAGLQAGDVLVSFDGVEARRGFGAAYELLTQRIGKTVKVAIKRNGESKTVEMPVAGEEEMAYRLVEVSNPTPQQLKVRDRWLMTGQ